MFQKGLTNGLLLTVAIGQLRHVDRVYRPNRSRLTFSKAALAASQSLTFYCRPQFRRENLRSMVDALELCNAIRYRLRPLFRR
jgi:hypothetical protein